MIARKYALNLSDDRRVLSVTYAKYAPEDAVLVDYLPEGELSNYRWVDGSFVYDPPAADVEAIRAEKEQELSAACSAAIVSGMDVETTHGAEHFALQETDQINLTTAMAAVQDGASGYPYHADGQLCRMFTAAEIKAIAAASVQHKLYHTTLCNHLLTWARRAETAAELGSITYTAEGLPDDLAANMAAVLAEAAGDGNE